MVITSPGRRASVRFRIRCGRSVHSRSRDKGDIIDLIGTGPAGGHSRRTLPVPAAGYHRSAALERSGAPPGKPDYNSDEAEKFQNRGWKDNAEPAAENSGKTARKYKERKTKGIKQDWHNQRTSGRKSRSRLLLASQRNAWRSPSLGGKIPY